MQEYTLGMNRQSDILYKQLFAHPEILRELLTGFLAADWAHTLSVGAFERMNASYVSERGAARHDDMVWRVSIGGEWVYVYILLEFQSRSDHWMALRMQVYTGLLYQDLIRQRRLARGRKLPPVIPVVLYSGSKPWRAATDIADLMLAPPQGLEDFQPHQKYFLIEQRNPADELRSNVLALVFQVLCSKNDHEMRSRLAMFFERIKEPDMSSARASLTQWMRSTLQNEFSEMDWDIEEVPVMLFDQKFKRYEDLLEFEAIERGRVKGRVEGLEEGLLEGRAKGKQEGRQEGRQEGGHDALRTTLQDVLKIAEEAGGRTFPPDVFEKIAAANAEQLRAWIGLLFRGQDPQQLFAPE